MGKFVNCERNQAFLLPPDLRDWMPEDDLAHFVIEAIPTALGLPKTALADNGYANGDAVESLAEIGIEALAATGAEGRRRTHDFRPAKARAPPKEPKADWLKAMAP